jgi:hypothetical protein
VRSSQLTRSKRTVKTDPPGFGNWKDFVIIFFMPGLKIQRGPGSPNGAAVNSGLNSCRRFRANEGRLWPSLIAYNLGNRGGGGRVRKSASSPTANTLVVQPLRDNRFRHKGELFRTRHGKPG